MKKIIAKNPRKAEKISLILFVFLMLLSGFLGSLFGSLLVWSVLFSFAFVQIYYVTKWAQYYIAQNQSKILNDVSEFSQDFIELSEREKLKYAVDFFESIGGVNIDKNE